MATTWTVQPMRVAKSKYDAAPLRNDQYIVESSASYIKGEPLMRGSTANALITWAAASSATVVGVATLASSSAGSAAYMHEMHEGTILEGACLISSSAAFAQTHIGAYGELDWQASSSAWVINLVNASSANHARVVGLAGMSEIGDFKPRVEFVLVNARIAKP